MTDGFSEGIDVIQSSALIGPSEISGPHERKNLTHVMTHTKFNSPYAPIMIQTPAGLSQGIGEWMPLT